MLAKRIGPAMIFCLAAIAHPLNVFGQAWLPSKGDGSVTVTYQKLDVRYHYDNFGVKTDKGQIHTHVVVTALEYGVSDKFALNFDLAFIASKYVGLRPHGPPDTGFYHPTFQDGHIELRYKLFSETWAVAPFVGVTLPTHDYEVRGHSAVGRGFKEVFFGINVGRAIDAFLPNGYVNVRYAFAMHKRFAGLNLNHSNADVEVGWNPARLITFRFIAALQKTHGGFQFPRVLDHDDFDIHDRVAREDFIQLGGGVTFALNRSLDVHVAYAPVPVYARNIHGEKGIIIGFSWRFSQRSAYRRIAALPFRSNSNAVQGSF